MDSSSEGERRATPRAAVRWLLTAWDKLAERRLGLWFFAGFLLIIALKVSAAPHRAHRWVYDSFSLLDGGWRVLNGQRPHVDFFSGIGPASYLVVALGMALSRSAAAIDYGLASAAALFGIWAWLLFRNRLERPAAVLLALLVTMITCAPHTIGSRPDQLTDEGIYNRLGYAMIFLVTVECLRPPRVSSPRSELAGGISTGAACLLPFFVKPSFFLEGVILIAASLLFRDRRSLKRCLGLGIGLVGSTLAMLAYLRFDVVAVFQDLSTMTAARMEVQAADPRVVIGPRLFLRGAYEDGPLLIVLLVLALLLSSLPRAPRVWKRVDAWWPLAAAAAIYTLDAGVRIGNGLQITLPLVEVFGLLLACEMYAWWSRAPQPERQDNGFVCGVCLLLGLVMFLPEVGRDFSSLAYAALEKARDQPVAARFEPAHLRALVTLDPNPDWEEPANGKALVDEINDGIDLLRRASPPTEKVMTVNYVNPFSFALLRRPAAGAGSFLSPGFFNERHSPPFERMFGQADVMMMPKHPEPSGNTRFVMRVVRPWVEAHFHPAAESADWILYRRNDLKP